MRMSFRGSWNKNLLFLIAAIFIFSACGESSGPQDLLRLSFNKAKQVNSAEYDIEYITMSIKDSSIRKRHVMAEREITLRREFFRINITSPDSGEIIYDGKDFVLLNHLNDKAVIPGEDQTPFRMINMFKDVYGMILVRAGDSLNLADTLDYSIYEGERFNVEGHPCMMVEMKTKDEYFDSELRYYISKKDTLIRSLENVVLRKGKRSSYSKYTITNLKTNIDIPGSVFNTEIPEGYEVDEYSGTEK